MKYLLDTNVIIDLLRNPDGPVAQRLAEAGGISFCAVADITLYELYSGAWMSKDPQGNIVLIDKLKEWLEIIPVSECYLEASKQKVRLKKLGQKIEDIDILIGSTAIVAERILVTGNTKHMGKLIGISLTDWNTDK
ncbi:MAG: PIN domain-containing protein [Bacteroidales bacterium]|nr:PIN domain-containing protein [Bacteroidales bacterium]